MKISLTFFRPLYADVFFLFFLLYRLIIKKDGETGNRSRTLFAVISTR